MRDTEFEIGFGGQTVTYLDPLASTSQIRLKPVECLPGDPKPIVKSSQEDDVVYGVEGSGKVKQRQCCDLVTLLASIDARISLLIFSRAVSVE